MPRVAPAELVEGLLDIGALRLGDFTLSSGRKSGYYLDLRMVPSHPEIYRLVLDAYRGMADVVGADRFDALAGVATSGLLMSSPLAVFLGKPMVYVRREDKGHGTRRLVEGDVPAGSRVLLVDDLATSGSSLAQAVTKLRNSGLSVTDALVLVDRLEGASSRLRRFDVNLTSFVTIEDIAPSLKKGGGMREGKPNTITGRKGSGSEEGSR
jgi:orotate phosphoribosyltransferase